MKIPTIAQAEDMLAQAAAMNPGPWVDHSRSAAANARYIAEKCEGMDADAAYAVGLLHDIGRREGVKQIMHLFDGYYYLLSQGYADAADICLTHSFPYQDAGMFFGEYDCSQEQERFLYEHISGKVYNDYDRLIQLCDALSMPNGAVLMEKRFVDVAMRHGLPDFTLKKWQASMELKKYFDQKAGCNIYTLLPNIIDNTFVNM